MPTRISASEDIHHIHINYYTHASSSPHIPLPEPEARYSTKPSHESGPEEVCRGQKKPNGLKKHI